MQSNLLYSTYIYIVHLFFFYILCNIIYNIVSIYISNHCMLQCISLLERKSEKGKNVKFMY